METQFKYRERPPEARRNAINSWLCDYPWCQKVYHYSPFCPNKRKFLFKIWRFTIHFDWWC